MEFYCRKFTETRGTRTNCHPKIFIKVGWSIFVVIYVSEMFTLLFGSGNFIHVFQINK